MRVQGIGLEHHGDIAVFWGNVVDHLIADQDAAFGDIFQSGQAAQRSGLTTAGRPYQNQKFFVFDLDVKIVDGDDITKTLVDVVKSNTSHWFSPFTVYGNIVTLIIVHSISKCNHIEAEISRTG